MSLFFVNMTDELLLHIIGLHEDSFVRNTEYIFFEMHVGNWM